MLTINLRLTMTLYELGVLIADQLLLNNEETRHSEWSLQIRTIFYDKYKDRPIARDLGTVCLHNPKLFQGNKLLKRTGIKCGDKIDVTIKEDKIRIKK